MSKRLKILLIVLASLFGIAVLRSPWPLILLGTIRGEHFYGGRPTCYWSQQTYAYVTDDFAPKPAVLSGEPETTPVLLELAKDRNSLVRIQAIGVLLWANPRDEELLGQALSSLIEILQKAATIKDKAAETPNLMAIRKAADLLGWIGPRAKDAIPVLQQAQNGVPDNVWITISFALQQIDPELRPFSRTSEPEPAPAAAETPPESTGKSYGHGGFSRLAMGSTHSVTICMAVAF